MRMAVLLWKNYRGCENFLHHKEHKVHKEKLCVLCIFVVQLGCGQSDAMFFTTRTSRNQKKLTRRKQSKQRG